MAYTPRKNNSKFTRPERRGSGAPVPFPQKPPYRPGKPTTQIGATKKDRYGFLPSRDKKPFPTERSLTSRTPKTPRKFIRPKPSKTQYVKYAPRSLRPTTSWGAVASWYDKHLAGSDTYHEKVILPNLTRLVDAQKDELILDLASGQGYFTRALAQSDAKLTGLDISPELIAIAKKEGGENVSYKIGSAEDLSGFVDGHFNKVVIVLAIQNIEYVHKVFNEAARVTKTGGTFHIVMNHPAFRIPKQSSWGYDEKSALQYRRVDQYLSESRSEIDMHPGMKDSPQTISFHRSLQYYIKALVKAGFVVDRFEEWISHKESDSGPRAKAENRARKEIPLFLYIRGRKI